MKLSILDANALNPGDLSWDGFRNFADVFVYERTPDEMLFERIDNSDAILINKIAIDRKLILKCKKLKYIGILATGYNTVDVSAAKDAGIVVTNIPAYSTMAVAQHVFAFILHFSNHVAFHSSSVKAGEWISSPDFCYWKAPLTELYEKKIGIIGYGNIGKQVEKIAIAFGMKPLVFPHRPDSSIENLSPLDRLLSESDFISLHVPLTENTRNLINRSTISKMKDGVFIVNTARGGIVNELHMKEALESKKVGGYAADVIEHEPMDEKCPLLKTENCVLTPHIAWASLETRKRLLNIALDNFKYWLNGKIQNSIY